MDVLERESSAVAPIAGYPADVEVQPALENRNRLTTAFRFILAIPHLLLVGAPIGFAMSWMWGSDGGPLVSAAGGVLGAVAAVCALIGWVAIVFGKGYPDGLWNLAAFYLRWRVRAVAYTALLRDEYPPFGDGAYPARLTLETPTEDRDRLTVAFRIVLALPHILIVWVLGLAWVVTTVIAWFSIVFTGRYPASLYEFAVGVLRWNTRVDSYLLLLHDEYPPFSF